MPRKLEPGRAAAGPTTEGLGTARNLSMPTKQRRAATDYAHALSIAKRAGPGISGALNGAIVASYYLSSTRVSLGSTPSVRLRL